MSESTASAGMTLAQVSDPVVTQLTRIADAQFGTKNALLAQNILLNKILMAVSGQAMPPPAPAPTTGTGGGSPVTVQVPDSGSAVIERNQLEIRVGSSRTIKEPADALALMAPGGSIIMDDGIYLKPFHNDVDGLVVMSASGMPRRCIMDGQYLHGGGHNGAWQKAIIHTSVNMLVVGIGFVRGGSTLSTDNYSNEAAIWAGDSASRAVAPQTGPSQTPWMVSAHHCTFDDCGNGIFASDEPALTIAVDECIFGQLAPNGMNASAALLGSHAAHDIYSSAGKTTVTESYFFGSVGHDVKTRSGVTSIRDCPVMCSDGGRVLDACEGGVVEFVGNTCWTRTDRQGVKVGQNDGAFGNANLLGYALEEPKHGIPGATLSGNVFHVSRSGATIAAGNGGAITSTNDRTFIYGQGGLNIQGRVEGFQAVVLQPGAPPAFPPLPAWALA